MRSVRIEPTFEAWRAAAQGLLADGTRPEQVSWDDGRPTHQAELLAPMPAVPTTEGPRGRARVPRGFLDLARRVSCHANPERWALLFRVLWRLTHEDRALLANIVDDDVHALRRLAREVARDAHHMEAFVRFRRVATEDGDHYVAWHRPDHDVLPLVAGFFVSRFASQRWTILTPLRSAHWDGEALHWGAGAPRAAAPAGDELEHLWRAYYAGTFNPARLNLRLARQHMPTRYRAALPETADMAHLVASADEALRSMLVHAPPSAAPLVDRTASWDELARAATGCTACPLHAAATTGVFGEGPPDARLVVVGEQPGDEEDRQGRPFVGPAGQLLDRALATAGLDRRQVYLTNTVKHFKFTLRGKRRIHEAPARLEVGACRPWLEEELRRIEPEVVVALGATAARALLGASFALMRDRGQLVPSPLGVGVVATVHPAAVLRAADPVARERLFEFLCHDLGVAAGVAAMTAVS